MRRPLPWLLLLLWSGFLAPPAIGASPAVEAPEKVFRVGLARMAFRNVERRDAKVAFRAFMEENRVFRELGLGGKIDVAAFESLDEFSVALSQSEMGMVVMNTLDYLEMDLPPDIQPHFVIAEANSADRRYLLLVREGSGIRSLADLRGSALLQLEMAHSGAGRLWLETELLRQELPPFYRFFGSVDTVTKPTAAVLPVFFGSRQACLVDEPSFVLMNELNPQVGKSLRVVKRSDPYTDVVICLGERGWQSKRHREDTIRILRDLHTTPRGRQLLTLFKVSALVPFEDRHLESARRLREEYQKLRDENLRKGQP